MAKGAGARIMIKGLERPAVSPRAQGHLLKRRKSVLQAGVSLALGLPLALPMALGFAGEAAAQATICATSDCRTFQLDHAVTSVSTFGTLTSSADGLAVLAGNAVVEIAIYQSATPAEQAQAAKDASGNISGHIWSKVDSPISHTMIEWAETGTMPGNIIPDVEAAYSTIPSGKIKDYYVPFYIYADAYGVPEPGYSVGNPRPFVALPAVGTDPWTTPPTSAEAVAGQEAEWEENVSEASFASGHTMRGYMTGIYYAMLLPTYYQDLFAASEEYALSRNVLGMHYPLDVIGGRIVAMQALAQLMAEDPNYSTNFADSFVANQAALNAALGAAAVSPLYQACSADVRACMAAGLVPTAATYRANRELATYYLTYGLPSMGDTTLAPVVPQYAEELIRSRFPYLTDAQLRDVLASTELASGAPLDNGSGWARINLYAAAGGYGAFTSDVTVTMDAAKGGLNAFDIWSNDISGIGGLTKDGTGTLLLAGDSTYSGDTYVKGGLLALTGSLAGDLSVGTGAAFVNNGRVGGDVDSFGSLEGGGVIGGDLVNRGTLLPGAAPGITGVMRVDGNLTFTGTSVYIVETAGFGQNDRVSVGGNVLLDGTLMMIGADGNLSKLGTYEVISAQGGISGDFDDVTALGDFLTATAEVSGSSVLVDVAPNAQALATAGRTPNANAVGAAVARLPYSSTVLQAAVTMDQASAPAMLASLTGEIHASTASVLGAQSVYLRQALLGRLREDQARQPAVPLGYAAAPVAGGRPDAGLTTWFQAYGGWGSVGGGSALDVTSSVGGFFTGFDWEALEGTRLGLAAGYSSTSYSTSGVQSSGSSNNYDVALYGQSRFGALTLRYAASYTGNDIETKRYAILPGLMQNLRADQSGGTSQIFGEAGYGFETGAVRLEPFAGLAYVNLNLGSYVENGGSAALASNGLTQDNTLTTLGLRGRWEVPAGAARMELRGSLAWQHAFGDVTPWLVERFVTGGSTFGISGAPIAQDLALVDAGLDVVLASGVRLGVAYTGQLGSEAQNNGVLGRLSVQF